MVQHNWRDVYFDSDDGLKLFARDYGNADSTATPVLCLAGLTRNSRDFHHVASRLASHRRVIVPDYRGRGLSQYASDWATYQPDVEMADAIKLLDLLGIKKVVVIGTSRGGLIAMLMAHFHKDRLSGVVLNDIGPKIEDEGLLRIAESINVPVRYDNWDRVVRSLKKYSIGFAGLDADQWLEFAENLYVERDDGIVPDYDCNLTRTFPSPDFIRSGKIPESWELFAALKGIPTAVVRGENSDLLSSATVARMRSEHDSLIVATVPDRAHVPFLTEPEAVEAIDQVLARQSATRPG